MSASDSRLLEFYERSGAERAPLVRREGQLEFVRTKELLNRFLPPPPARIIDVGGGTGAYSSWLASLGHSVHLVDVVPGHVEEASKNRTFSAVVGDARALPAPDASYESKVLCNDCGYPVSWLRGGQALLMNTRAGAPDQARNVITWFDLTGRAKQATVIEHPSYSVWNAKVSPNGRWVVFHVSSGKSSQIYAAPWQGGASALRETRGPITGADQLNDKAFWSPNGRLIYFISDRDGFGCLYAQRIDPDTGRLIGAARDVKHFHETRHSLIRVGMAGFGITASLDKIVFSMVTSSTDVWLLEP
jgi:hypothetical protein